MKQPGSQAWHRRARPLLGTLVEVGLRDDGCGAAQGGIDAAFDVAFAAVQLAQDCLSRFDPNSDLSLFHAARLGERVTLRPITVEVLVMARELHAASSGLFDISLGTAAYGWALEGSTLIKLHEDVRLDLGGIGKGHAVDMAVQAMTDLGCSGGWVNAGGDLRAFGDVDAPIHLRDENRGGVRRFAMLHAGAFATSAFGADRRSQLTSPDPQYPMATHVSVAAPRCMWADALTKVVAASGDACHPLLTRYGGAAWLHG